MAAIPKMMKKRFSLFIVLVYHAWLLCGVHASTPPGTLLTLHAEATWEGCEHPAMAELNLVVVQPNAREVVVTHYDPTADGWPVVWAVPPVTKDPWSVGGVVRGWQLKGGGMLTRDGMVINQ
jgi:hypothetical protein